MNEPRDQSESKELTRAQALYHPAIDDRIDRLFCDQNLNLSVRAIVLSIATKQAFKLAQKDKAELKGEEFEDTRTYAWFPSEYYQRLLGPPRYSSDMKALVDAGVLESTTVTSKRGRHPLYKLPPEVLTAYRRGWITMPRVLKKIKNYRKWRDDRWSPLIQRVMKHIAIQFDSIDLTRDSFLELWRRRYYERYLKVKSDPLSIEDYLALGCRGCWPIIDRWNTGTLEDRLDMMSVDSFGNRLHHPFSYLPSEVRAYVLDKAKIPVMFIEYDLRNSQPAIFANMMVQRYPGMRDISLVRSIEEARVYEDLAVRMGYSVVTKEIRDIAKTEFMRMLYCKPGNAAHKRLVAYYGPWMDLVTKMKSQENDNDGNWIPKDERHKMLPRQMQRLESIMFQEAWAELIAQRFVFLPVHDGIYIRWESRSRSSEARMIIRSVLNRHMKIKYIINTTKILRIIK